MTRLVITPRAAADLEDIGDYIAEDKPAAADRLVARLREASELLGETPRLGMARPDIAPDVRHFPIGNYLILYRALGDGAEIVRYVHGRRRLRDLV
jgi:toxin ParE1/3/4